MGCNTRTVVLAHCLQIISHTPTGMAPHPRTLGANKIIGDSWRYRVYFFHTTNSGGGKEKLVKLYLLGLLQVKKSNVPRLFIAGDNFLLSVGGALDRGRRASVLIRQGGRGSWKLL